VSELHVAVRGRVQGVGFRWFVRERARRLGLAGWVRNQHDGSVEVAARGAADALRALEAALREGPDGAYVMSIDELPPATDEPIGAEFTILR
jgi:acylphosphatase